MRSRQTWAAFALLVFVATTLFTIIQHPSLNQLWQIQP
jgi:membrane protein